jgi:hypothetical protein
MDAMHRSVLSWELFAIRTDRGTPLRGLTIKKATLDFQGYQFQQESGITMPTQLNWAQFISTNANELKDPKTGKLDAKKVLSFAEIDYEVFVKETSHREKLEKRIPDALHKFFDEYEGNEVERHTALGHVVSVILQTPIKKQSEEIENVKEWLKRHSDKFVMQGKPVVHLFRLVDQHGKPTGVIVPEMGMGSGGVPSSETGGRRLTKNLQEWGVRNRAELASFYEFHEREHGNAKPTQADVHAWLEAGDSSPSLKKKG